MKKVFGRVSMLFAALSLAGAGCQATQVTTSTNTNTVTNIATNTSTTTNVNTPKVSAPKENVLTFSGLTFILPADWSAKSVVGSTANLSVPDPKYHVVIPFKVDVFAAADANRLKLQANELLKETSGGAQVYRSVCAPGTCYYIVLNGKTYNVVFEVPESDEPVPANLDGVWFPSTTVTEEQMFAIVTSVR